MGRVRGVIQVMENRLTHLRDRWCAATLWCALAMLCVALSGCSTKKNTAASRQWQAFTTRYNVYFNGIEHYKEQLASMEREYEDDYTRMLLTHPAEARADEKRPQPKGDFKRTLEKMQKAIQLHSIKKKPPKKSGSPKEKAFRAREEFNPFLHNAWMTMGRAQFMNGDFLGAASTFQYISKHFTWLPAVVTEARLWQARSYCAMDWTYEAENLLSHIKEAELTSGTLRDLYALTEADYLVRSGEYAAAAPYIEKAARAASGTQKNRLWFLLGQVRAHLGDRAGAYAAYRKAASGMSTPYRTKFNARIKMSEVFSGSDIRGEVKALRSMLRYERNKEFQDQIYYAIGNLYMSRGDTAEAKRNYALAVEKSTRSGIDKALANLALGTIYFDERDYVEAQPCYAEAVPQLPETYPDYRTLKRRSDVLDELAVYAGNVELQDSLLTLAAMTPEEQREVCQRIVDELIRKEKEEAAAAAREEFMANQPQVSTPMDQATPPAFQMNTDKSWYFYNNTAKQAGKAEFQRKWGSRKLEDDWRRRNKTTFSFDDLDEGEVPDSLADRGGRDGEPADSVRGADDPHNVEYYLRQIPSTPEEIATANDIIQEGLYNLGVILKDKLEDFPAARREFETLDTRYPDNVYRLDAYYNLYLMAVRSDDAAEAEIWRRRIMEDFPDSPYAKAMADPDYFEHLRQMHALQEGLYAEAYEDYLADRNDEVHEITARMERDYPLSSILPKFVFIDALSYLTEGDYDRFKERLSELLQRWPDTDMTDMAGSILKGLNAGRTPHSGSANTRGLLWEMRLTADGDEVAGDGQPARFERDPNSPQYLVLAFPRDEVNANELLYEVARFNFSSFVVKDFDMEPMSFGNVGLLVIKGFANVRELEHYRRVMADTGFTLPEGVRPIMISRPNFELLLREGRSFEEYFRYEEEAAAAETEAGVLDAEDDTDGSGTESGDAVESAGEEPEAHPDGEAEGESVDDGAEETAAPETEAPAPAGNGGETETGAPEETPQPES